MKRVTKKNLLKLIDLKKEYDESPKRKTLTTINDYIDNIINTDARYYSKLSSYNFNNDQLKYLL